MANDGIDIPVVVDLYGGFEEAVKDIPSAIKMTQAKIDENILEVPVEINKKGDIAEVLDFVGNSTKSFDELKYAIKNASSELARLKRKGASQEDIETYQKAVVLLKSIKLLWEDQEKIAKKTGDSWIRSKEVYIDYERALNSSLNNINDMNSSLSAYMAMLNNADFGSKQWEDAAKKVGEMSRELAKVQANIKVVGAESRSVEQITAKVHELNVQWEQMAMQKKFVSDGKLSAEAQALYDEYKRVNKCLKEEGQTMSELLAKEEKRIKKVKDYLDKRKEEKKILEANANTIAALEAKIAVLRERLSNTAFGSKAFNALNAELKTTQAQLDLIQSRVSGIDDEFKKTDTTFTNLLKKSAYLFGLHTITRFLREIREVTAEFEMQRVALGGIIHDTEEANMLFRQIKAAAIESPFQIKELVTYTKQLSAYRIETENLFNVTMKLADVSAGLGVDMNRLVLAYGQVRAAAVLRGQELRQFTEAGIPLVDELAKKFSILNGKMVTTSEVFDLISKRAVPFEMIAEIFDDMTEKGGVFYKMQEKQAETLAGQWSNLKDALSIMYDEMGNTEVVHNAIERLIGDAKTLMQNWRTVKTILGTVVIQFGALKVASLFIPTLTRNTKLAREATSALAKAEALETAQQTKASVARAVAIKQLKAYSLEMDKAANAQNLFSRGWHKFAASMKGGGWIGLAVTAASVLVGWLISAYNEAHRLEKELAKIGNEGSLSINRSVSNFKRLADAAVQAADGSNEQNEALAELQRTYSDIIPSQNLQIEKLRELEGNYTSLTSAIEQKINMQIREQKVNAVTDYYAGKIQTGKKTAKNLLAQYGLDKDQINAVMDGIEKAVDDGMVTVTTSISDRAKVVEDIVKKLTGITVSFGQGFFDYQGEFHYEANEKIRRALNDLFNTYIALNEETDEIDREMKNEIGTMGVYAKKWDDLKKEIKSVTVSEKEFGKASTFAYKKEKIRKEVELLTAAIEDAFKETGIDISDAIKPEGQIDFDAISKAASESKRWGLDAYIKKIQESYESIVPSDQMVGVVERKFKQLAEAAGLSMDDIQGYLFRGNKDLRQYVKDLQDDLQEAEDKVNEYELIKQDSPFLVDQKALDKWSALAEILKAIIEWLDEFKKKTKEPRNAYVQDPYIKLMQDRIKFMQDFKKGYDDLNKYMSSSNAIAEQMDIMKERGLSLGLNESDQKMAANELSQWYSDMIDQAFEQAKQHGATGTVQEFLSQQITDTTNKGKALKDFQDLLRSLWDAKTDFNTTQVKKDFEDAIKRITDEVKRTDAARNFFQNILDLSGDTDLARSLTLSVYGEAGESFKENMQKQLDAAFRSLDVTELSDEVWAELSNAVATQDYDTILQYIDVFPEKWRDILRQMATDDQKYYADMANDLLKSLKNAKTYGDKRVELAKQTAQRIEQINQLDIDPVTRSELLEQNMKKESEEAAKLAYEAFKDTPMYVELFAKLDTVSTRMLKNMRDNIVSMKDQWKDLTPTELKELQSRIQELDGQLARRNPFRVLIDSMRKYRELNKNMKRKDAENATISADEKLKKEKAKLEVRTKEYETAVKTYGAESKQAEMAKRAMEYQQKMVDAAEKTAESAQTTANAYGDTAEKIAEAIGQAVEWVQYVQDITNSIRTAVEPFLDDDVAETFGLIMDGIDSVLGGSAKIGGGIKKILTLDVFGGISDIVSGIGDMISGIALAIQGINIKKIDKEIKHQAELVEDLQKSYSNLEKAMAKAFGSDYIANYSEQLENLQAQIDAYNKQAELEESKGKKADAEKAKEYRNAAAEAEQQLADLGGKLAEYFTESDLTSAAKEFANSWIEAYKEFGSTTSAMKEKFQDMIQNMITNSLAAKLIQSILKPLFDQIDEMAASDGMLTAQEIAQIAQSAPEYIDLINNAMTGLMNELGAAGYNMRRGLGSFSGISRDIASASEESINGLAAGINTQNFYMSLISQNVASILASLTGEEVQGSTGAAVPDSYKEQMLVYAAYIPQMHDDMYAVRAMLEKVIKPNGTNATHYVATRM